MDLFTLNSSFLAEEPVDEFISVVWVERYTSPGEVQLEVPATVELLAKLQEGKFLGLRGSKEVMQLETQSIENGVATIKGNSLLQFLNERQSWFANPAYASNLGNSRVLDKTAVAKPGQFIADVVSQMVIDPDTYGGANLEWAQEVIPNLELGSVDTSGDAIRLTAPLGPLLDAVAPIADQYGVGISLYLESANPVDGYVLKFTTYKGVDRTSTQTDNELVRLVPDLDSLTDVKELRSIAGYKNVAYVMYNNEVSVHYADPDMPIPEGFARRSLMVQAETSPTGHTVTYTQKDAMGKLRTYTYTTVDPDDVAAFRAQVARDALANHNYIRAVDGQTSPINEYQFGEHYFMGDIIELQGLTGQLSKARITEYIRSQDRIGERAYPTISVIT